MNESSKLQLFDLVQRKHPDDLLQLERLEPTSTATLSPYERLERACRLGQLYEKSTGRRYKPYTNVANTIRYWLVKTDVPGQETLRPCEELVAAAELAPQDFKKLFAQHDDEAAESRKQVVKDALEGRRDALSPLLSLAFRRLLKNQITQKTSATRGIVKDKAIKMRHDFFVEKHFSKLLGSRGAEPVHFAEAGPSTGGNSLAATPLTTVAETPDFSALATPSSSVVTPAADWASPGELPDLVLPGSIHGPNEEISGLLYDYVAAACGDVLRQMEFRLELGLLRKNQRILEICREGGHGFESVECAICDWVLNVQPQLDDVSMNELELSIVIQFNMSELSVADLQQSIKAEVDKIVRSRYDAVRKLVDERCEVAKCLLQPSVCTELKRRVATKMELMRERIHREVLEGWSETLAPAHFRYILRKASTSPHD